MKRTISRGLKVFTCLLLFAIMVGGTLVAASPVLSSPLLQRGWVSASVTSGNGQLLGQVQGSSTQINANGSSVNIAFGNTLLFDAEPGPEYDRVYWYVNNVRHSNSAPPLNVMLEGNRLTITNFNSGNVINAPHNNLHIRVVFVRTDEPTPPEHFLVSVGSAVNNAGTPSESIMHHFTASHPAAGSPITITRPPVPVGGYTLPEEPDHRWHVVGLAANEWTRNADGSITFTMPARNVLVTALWNAPITPPAFHAPDGLRLRPSNLAGYPLDWNPVPGANGYRIYVNNTFVGQVTGDGTEFVIPHDRFIRPGSNDITVVATRASGSYSGHSDALTRTFAQNQVLPLIAPTVVSISQSGIVTWSEVPNATGYRVYVNGRPTGFSYVTGSFTADISQYINTPGTYQITVRALNSSNLDFYSESAPSVPRTHVVAASPTQHPIIITHTPSSSTTVNGGSPASGTTRVEGNVVTLIPGTRAGYEFVRWFSHDVYISQNLDTNVGTFTMPNRQVSVIGQWRRNADPTFTVTIDPGGGRPHVHFTNIVAGVMVPLNAQRDGYRFVNWTSDPDWMNNHINSRTSANAYFQMPQAARNVTITANWSQNANSIFITNLPPGAPLVSNQTSPANPVPVGTQVGLTPGTRGNYVFTGWSTSDLPSSYTNGVTGNLTFDMPDRRVNVTAHWAPPNVPLFTTRIYREVHGVANSREFVQTLPQSAQGTQGMPLNAGSWQGHEFIEWRVATNSANVNISNRNIANTTFTMPGGDVVIYSVWRRDATPLTAPSTSIVGNELRWTSVSGAARYYVYVNGARTASSVGAGTGQRSFNLNQLGLTPGTYNIQLRAIAPQGSTTVTDSELSAFLQYVIEAPVTPDDIRPTGLSIINSTLRWNPVFGATRYYIYVNNSRRATIQNTNTSSFSVTSPSFDLSTLTNPRLSVGGTGYDIQVRAVVGSVASHLSEVRRFYDAVPPLPRPTNVRIIGNPTLHWDFPTTGHPNLVGFRIYVNGQASVHMVGPTARSFPIANLGLTSGTYLIGVRAVSTGVDNSDSYLSTFVQYTSATLPALNTPIGLAINSNILSWNAVPNATGYRIYVNGQPSTAGIVGGLSFNLANLNLGAGTHLIQVRALGNNTTHVDSAVSAFVSYVLNTGQVAGVQNNPTSTPAPRINQYVATFNPGAGTFPAGEDGLRMGPAGFTINSFTNVPTRAGYTFGGWSVGGAPVSLPLTVSGDMTLNAIWNRVEAGPSPSPTPAPGARPNPQTGAFGLLNIMGVLVLTGGSVFTVKMLNRKKKAE